MGHYIKLFPIQFELFWIPPLSSSVKLWKLADCLLQLIIGECLDITIDICYMTTMLRTFDHGKQYSIKLSYRKYKIFSCLQLLYRFMNCFSTKITLFFITSSSSPRYFSCKGFFPWSFIYYIWWCFSPQNGESGGTFCPHSGNVAKIQFRFTIHTNLKLSISPLR